MLLAPANGFLIVETTRVLTDGPVEDALKSIAHC
jgi:hypothetical protein